MKSFGHVGNEHFTLGINGKNSELHCFHLVLDHHADGSRPDAVPKPFLKEVYTFDDFLRPIYTIVSTGAIMLRDVLPSWPGWLFVVKPIDFSLVLLYTE